MWLWGHRDIYIVFFLGTEWWWKWNEGGEGFTKEGTEVWVCDPVDIYKVPCGFSLKFVPMLRIRPRILIFNWKKYIQFDKTFQWILLNQRIQKIFVALPWSSFDSEWPEQSEILSRRSTHWGLKKADRFEANKFSAIHFLYTDFSRRWICLLCPNSMFAAPPLRCGLVYNNKATYWRIAVHCDLRV